MAKHNVLKEILEHLQWTSDIWDEIVNDPATTRETRRRGQDEIRKFNPWIRWLTQQIENSGD